MNLSKLTAAVALAAAASFGGSAIAAVTFNTGAAHDGVLSPFGAIDYASGSVAWTSGLGVAAAAIGAGPQPFTIFYAGYASDIQNSTGNSIRPFASKLDVNANGAPGGAGAYELTAFATLQATLFSITATTATYKVDSGTFNVYYDNTLVNAFTPTNGAWSGFVNGTPIISGTLAGTKVETLDDNAVNSLGLTGSVLFTNNAFINPDLTGTTVGTTLQLGSATTGFGLPLSVDGIPINYALGDEAFQADANQAFQVPEPATLLILGAALAGLGVTSRRRSAKAQH